METYRPASSFWSIVHDTDWPRLSHAYGAASNTPRHLAALAGSDVVTRKEALNHLWGDVLHQGSLYSATPIAVEAVAALLPHVGADELVERWTEQGTESLPLRAELLDFLAAYAASCFDVPDEPTAEMANPPGREAEVARIEAGAWVAEDDDHEPADDELANALWARWVLAAREGCPRLVDPVVTYLMDPHLIVRICAANCLARLCRHPDVEPRRSELAKLIEQGTRGADTQERAALVLSLGDLGADTTPFLADPDQAVRCCAALAPSQRGNPAATREILAALADPVAADRWLPRPVPQIEGRLRFTLVREAIQRVSGFEELLPVALAIARDPTTGLTFERDWEPLLEAAFPTRFAGSLSPAQRTYLGALVANAQLWDPTNGVASYLFKRIGLPYDRDACRALLHTGT